MTLQPESSGGLYFGERSETCLWSVCLGARPLPMTTCIPSSPKVTTCTFHCLLQLWSSEYSTLVPKAPLFLLLFTLFFLPLSSPRPHPLNSLPPSAPDRTPWDFLPDIWHSFWRPGSRLLPSCCALVGVRGPQTQHLTLPGGILTSVQGQEQQESHTQEPHGSVQCAVGLAGVLAGPAWLPLLGLTDPPLFKHSSGRVHAPGHTLH